MSRHSSPYPSCFKPSSNHNHPPPSAPPPPPPPPAVLMSGNPNLTTCLYHTDLALFSLTWSRSFLGRSLHLHLLPHAFDSPPPLSSIHLHIKPFIFWKKHGSKKLSPNISIFWDLSKAKFGSRSEPQSGFYIAVIVDKEMTLLIGDMTKEAYAKTKPLETYQNPRLLILKREHVFAHKVYSTTAKFGGKLREILIDCVYNDCTRLSFSVDDKRVLQIKRLKWKFRGNERIEVDGVPIQISWDVYNWLFENENDDGPAVFMLRFEEDENNQVISNWNDKNGMGSWVNQQNWNLGMNDTECRKMQGKMSLSTSSVSMSSAGSSAGSLSVMEWANVEESELCNGPCGFTLQVYAWRK